MTQFTEHFTTAELACRCGCGMLPQRDFIEKIERLRVRLGFPFIVTSAARCSKHNSQVSGTGKTGPHTTGRAIDIRVSGAQAVKLLTAALQSGDFTGFGIQQKCSGRFIHLDDLVEGYPRPGVWSY
jgi:uncharacterized protein YcbK (DUF882 family)